jgi:hypothetical protein
VATNTHSEYLLLPGAELTLIADSFGLLNSLLLPFLSILDASCPFFYLHLAHDLFHVIFTFQVPIYNLLLIFLCTRLHLHPLDRPVPFLR